MGTDRAIGMGVAGLGGFAGQVTGTIRQFGEALDPPARLIAVGDPALDVHADRAEALRGEGVTIHDDFEKVLAEPGVDAVWLPVPIDLHLPFTEQALAAGKAVMCEKPAAATVQEVDAMIAARDRAGLPCFIGFHDIYEPSTLTLKRRLLDGAIGRIRRATVHGCWPRSDVYFNRSGWAGRIKRDDAWILDSPLQNAMSHSANLAMFLLGDDEARSATPVSLEAELYRAAVIENFDTVSARVALAEGSQCLILFTHASADHGGPWLRIEGERGAVTWDPRHGGTINSDAGEETLSPEGDRRSWVLQAFTRAVRGQDTAPSTVSTLEAARVHTLLVNGVSTAAPIRQVPEDVVETVETPENNATIRGVRGIKQAFDQCAEQFQMLHESGALPFTEAPGHCELRDYNTFTGPHPDTAAPPAEVTPAWK